jgi:signal peptidase I
MQVLSDSESASIRDEVTSCLLNDLWEELLIKHGTCWARVVSDSMYPTIWRDAHVLVERARPDKVRFGDIIVFRRNGSLTIHRVIGKRKFGGECHFLEKGDANLQSSLVPATDIIGRVTIIRNAGKSLPTISGSGRLFQLTLACISYTSLQLRTVLKYCLTWGGHTFYKHP